MSALVGVLAALVSVEKVSLAPPGLAPRAVATAAAKTQALVDAPSSILLDLRQDTYSFQSYSNRALLLGNMIASAPVRQYIAAQVGVPATSLEITTPATPQEPLPRVDSGHPRRTTDILRLDATYRLSVIADPTVPILDINSEAPTVTGAIKVANAAIAGLKSYLAQIAGAERVPTASRVRVTQLGAAQGGVVNPAVNMQLIPLVFALAFGLAAASLLLLEKLRRAWGSSADGSSPAPGALG
jgi:hypothetical protein